MKLRQIFFCVLAILAGVCGAQAGTLVRFKTTLGSFDVELFDTDKPVTVANFLRYVHAGLYTNMFVHRVATNPAVMQGGGFFVKDRGATNENIYGMPTYPAITNEFKKGTFRSNVYGTLAMAKTTNANSATSQFFFNLVDNSTALDNTNNSGGFTVFGQVVSNTNVLNRFNLLGTNSYIKVPGFQSPFNEMPVLASAIDTNYGNFSYLVEQLIYVDVLISPVILSAPSNQTVVAGHPATFSVSADGPGTLAYFWLFKGRPIPGANSSTYQRSAAQLTDAGAYSVVVSNASGKITSSSATLTVMATPLATLSITSPANNGRVTNATDLSLLLTGTTGGTIGVTSVWWRINSAAWAPAYSTNDWARWTATNLLTTPGANLLSAYAVDTNGNHSATQTVRFTFVKDFSLTVSTNGRGTVTQTPKGILLPADGKVTLTAVPANNWLFSGWSGGIVSNASPITLTLRTNLALTANFVTNAFIRYGLAGTYNGLFSDPNTNNVRLQNSGFFSATVTAKGAYSGKLTLTNKTYSFSGQFNPALMASNRILLGSSPTTASLQFNGLAGRLDGILSNQNWMATLTAYPGGLFSKTNAGRFTLLIPGATNSAAQPGGEGFGAITLTAAGVASLSGSLADNTAFSPSALVSQQGLWPVYFPLYAGKGAIFGWLAFTNEPDNDLNGTLTWIKLGQSSAYYAGGFTNQPEALGSRYTPSVPAFGFPNGILNLSEGGISNAFANRITIGPGNAITSTNKSLKLTLTTASGLFQGSVANPDAAGTPKTLALKGAVLSKQTNGGGFFLGAGQTGRVVVLPAATNAP